LVILYIQIVGAKKTTAPDPSPPRRQGPPSPAVGQAQTPQSSPLVTFVPDSQPSLFDDYEEPDRMEDQFDDRELTEDGAQDQDDWFSPAFMDSMLLLLLHYTFRLLPSLVLLLLLLLLLPLMLM
jgi:hypothetical protein